jgi:hypothetical protein
MKSLQIVLQGLHKVFCGLYVGADGKIQIKIPDRLFQVTEDSDRLLMFLS